MKNIVMLQAMKQCRGYRHMDAAERNALREKRLTALVQYARTHSPYYARLYADLPEHPTLAALPPVNKRELMAHWDEWVTDRDITLTEVSVFMGYIPLALRRAADAGCRKRQVQAHHQSKKRELATAIRA